MNVQLPNATGHSFKGTMAYLMHDKRAEGMEAHPQTAERIAWTAIRNMPTNGPQTAARMMIDTAQRADELKAAAGIKSTGRKATGGAVYHLSINYHPDERGGNPSRDDMMKAADEVLKILGFEDLQAIMVCHHETGKPHVHVVVNRVHPVTGKMISAGPSKGHALDRWSHDFEVAGGQIFSQDRAAKFAEIDRKKEAHPDKADRKKYVDEQRAKAAEKSDTAKAWTDAARPKLEGAKLRERADALKAKHQQERAAAWADFKAQKDALWSNRPSFKAIAAQHRADTRADWSYFGKEQARQRRDFRTEERTFLGRVANATRLIQAVGWQPEMKGYLGMIFKWWAAPSIVRERALAELQQREKAEFAAAQKRSLDEKIRFAKTEHAAQLSRLGTQYDTAKALMNARHGNERQQMSEAWKEYFDRRDRVGRPSNSRPYRKPAPDSARRYTQQRARTTTAAPAQQPAQTRATGAAAVWGQAAQPKQPAPLKSYWSERSKPQQKPPRDRGRDREPEPER